MNASLLRPLVARAATPAVRLAARTPSFGLTLQRSLASSPPLRADPFRRAYSRFNSRGPVIDARARPAGGSSYGGSTAAPPQPSRLPRLLGAAGIVGAGALGLHMVLNRERREGGIPAFEREYLNSVFAHTGVALGTIAIAARQMFIRGYAFRLMARSPIGFALGGLAVSVVTMYGTMAVDPDNTFAKYGMWTAFNLSQALVVSPLLLFSPAVLMRAGLYTAGMIGSIAYIGATAKENQYLYIGGPLLAGGVVILLSGLAPMVLPATALRTLALSESLWMYGGLALFGGFTLYDVQKVLHEARMVNMGMAKRDPVRSAIGFELNFINIFYRMAMIMGNNNRRK